MNHVYRLKRSGRTQQLQAVPENARSAGKGAASTGKTLGQSVSATLASYALSGIAALLHAQQAPPTVPPTSPSANQLPQGGVVSRGSASINTGTSAAGNALMTVNQSSNRAVIDWSSFNVGASAKVQFNQPSNRSVVLNQILGNNASQIYGQISANGQVFLSNGNGIYFSPTAQVNVGALVATTGKANADDFMAGKTVFNRDGSTGSIVNEGQLSAALGGYIALLAPEVRNQGVIVAQAGTVALASGEAVTLNFNSGGTGLAGITTTPQTIAALVENRSAVLAEGGQIILSAHALATLQGSVVKNSGQLSATSITEKGGKIVLMADSIALTGTSRIEASGATGGGTVLVGGDWQGSGDTRQAVQVTMAQGASIEANATVQGDGGKVVLWSDIHNPNSVTQVEGRIWAKGGDVGGNGGAIETSGHVLTINDLKVSTAAPKGKMGQWLLDPYDVTISSASTSNINTVTGGYQASGNSSVLNISTLNAALGSSDVEIQTVGAGVQTGNITLSADVIWNAATQLKLSASGQVLGLAKIDMQASGSSVVFNTLGTASGVSYSGVISGLGAVIKTGAGNQTLTGYANTYTGGTQVLGGVLYAYGDNYYSGVAGEASGLGAIPLLAQADNLIINGGWLSLQQKYVDSTHSYTKNLVALRGIQLGSNGATFSGGALGIISGTGALTLKGEGVYLTGTNTYVGNTTIDNGGSATITNEYALGSQANQVVLNPGTSSLYGASLMVDKSAGTFNYYYPTTINGKAVFAAVGTNTTLNIRSQLNVQDAVINGFTYQATIEPSGGGSPTNTINLYGLISGTGGLKLVSSGSPVGIIGLYTAGNSYAGLTYISANLKSYVSEAIPNNSAVTLQSTWDLLGKTETIGSLAGSSGSINFAGATTGTGGSLLVGENNTNTTYSGSFYSPSNSPSSFTKNGTGKLTLGGYSNSYNGTIQVSAGTLAITGSNALGVSSAGNGTSVQSGATLELAMTGTNTLTEPITLNGGTLSATAGTTTLSGTLSLTADSTISVGADLTLTKSVSALSTSTKNLTIVGSGTLNLGAFGLTALGLNQTAGTITTTGAVGGLSSFAQNASATLNASTLTVNGSYAQSGSVTLTSHGSITQTSGLAALGTLTVGGNLTINTANGDITQSGPLTVTGASTLAVGTGNVTLSNANNDFTGLVNATGAAIQLTDKNSLTLGTVTSTGNFTVASTGALIMGTSTVGGNLNASSGGGAITQIGVLTVTGAGTLNSGAGNITLTDVFNNFTGAVSATGAVVQITDGNALTLGTLNTTSNLTVTSTGALDLGTSMVGGALSATSNNGDITQSGALAVTGISSLAAGTGNITLAHALNDFTGVVSATGVIIQITDKNALTLGTVVANNGLSVVSTGALDLGSSTVTGTLSAISNNGPISQTSALSVTSTTDLNAGTGNITLTNSSNNLANPVGALGASIQITNQPALTLNTVSASGNLTLISGTDAVSQTGALTVGGNTTVTATTVTLNNASNDFTGTVTVNAGQTSVRDTNSLVAVLNTTGATTLQAASDLVVSGTVTGAANQLTLDASGKTSFGVTTVDGDLVSTTRGANTSGGVLQTGKLTVKGSAEFIADTGADQDALLNNAANDFQDAVWFTKTNGGYWGNVSLQDSNDLALSAITSAGNLTAISTGAMTLSASTVGGNLSVTSNNGDISQSGPLTVTGTSSLNASTGNITLTNALNNFTGAVSATGAIVQITDANTLTLDTVSATGNLAVTSAGALGLGASTVGGNLSVTSNNGDITQSGPLAVMGTSSLTGGTGNIALTNALNDFSGALNAIGSAVQITNANTLTLGPVTTTGNLTVTSAGALDLGTITVGGDLNVSSLNSTIKQSGVVIVAGSNNLISGTTINSSSSNYAGQLYAALTATLTSSRFKLYDANIAVNAPPTIVNASPIRPAEINVVTLTNVAEKVQVTVLTEATSRLDGLVRIFLSDVSRTDRYDLLIPLGDQIDFGRSANNDLQLTLPNGGALPSWLRFDSMNKTLSASSVPVGALPLQVMLSFSNLKYLVVLLEKSAAVAME